MALGLALTLPYSSPALAYLRLGTRIGDRNVTLKWRSSPVPYFVFDRGVPGVSASQLQTTLARAFATWQDVPTASIAFRFAGFTSAAPLDEDSLSTLGFVNQPEMERVLGLTGFLIDAQTGEIVEADVLFNSAFPWSVSSSGEPGRFDLESIAVHEVGHFLGLGHSALGETELFGDSRRVIAAGSTMFPIAFSAGSILGRQLTADDIAGVSDVYPDGDFRDRTGAIAGNVRKSGRGVFGAHVAAFNLKTAELVGNFSINDNGEFVIAGLAPGVYVLRIEPLDDADPDSFFEQAAAVDVDFRVVFHPDIAVVGRGGIGRNMEVAVSPK